MTSDKLLTPGFAGVLTSEAFSARSQTWSRRLSAISGLSAKATWKRQRIYLANFVLSSDFSSQARFTIFFNTPINTVEERLVYL